MGNNFLNPSIDDIKDLIATLSSDKKIGPMAVEDNNQAIRRFYRWKCQRKNLKLPCPGWR
jgi:hypothetical protein